MDTLGNFVLLLLLAFIISTPIFCSCKKYNFVKHHLISAPLIIVAISIGSYWPHLYTDIHLDLMGFDFYGMSDAERVRNVAPELREEAARLYWSNSGIGWPLTALLWSVLLSPYHQLFTC